MVQVTLRQKIVLELYAILSLFATIVILLYYTLSGSIGTNIYLPVAGIICLFSGAFIYFLRFLIRDVNSIKFYEDVAKDESKVVEIKRINKITLEFFSTVSNVILIAAIIIYGISGTTGVLSEFLSITFIIIFSIPIVILIRYIIVYFNLIFGGKKDEEKFIFKLFNKGTLLLLLVGLIIVLIVPSGNMLFTSMNKIYEKPLSISGDTMNDLSSKIYITKISGERKDIPGAAITGLNIYIETTELNYYINSININYADENRTSNLEYGFIADGNHFSFRSENSENRKNILNMNEVGIVTINLSSTGQELYSNKKGTLQFIMGTNKNISKEIKVPELMEGSVIQLYKK
jgi:hypothetical protein